MDPMRCWISRRTAGRCWPSGITRASERPSTGRTSDVVPGRVRRGHPDAVTRRTPAIALGVLLIGGLAIVSLGPFPQPDLPRPLESLPHAAAYAVGMLIVLAAMPRRPGEGVRSRDVAIIAVSLIVVGAVLELAQRLVGRDVEAVDVLANALGVTIGAVVWTVVRRLGDSAADRGR